jgi:hypothetical protein
MPRVRAIRAHGTHASEERGYFAVGREVARALTITAIVDAG